jgi:MATE family multidrug resistance protein
MPEQPLEPNHDDTVAAGSHPFERRPHATLLKLSLPVLISLVIEPFLGLVDTAFVARLGAVQLAALGLSVTLLSGVSWVFNFLGIGTQTEVGRGLGAGDAEQARERVGLALMVATMLGVTLAALSWPWLAIAAVRMGADAAIRDAAVSYLQVRLLGLPAMLVTLAAFGALRGLQDMQTPLRVAVGANVVNAALDPLLIFGAGPLPALGVAGAAWATIVAQWIGGTWAVLVVGRRLGLSRRFDVRAAIRLLAVGRDLFLRTGLLFVFLLLATRVATRIGAEAGAAHQAIRQIWIFAALLLDAYAIAAQSLVTFFIGAQRIDLARKVCAVATLWGLATGLVLMAAMLLGRNAVLWLLVPAGAEIAFAAAWLPASLAQPLNALSFVTDGIHWGTADYRYLRNAMFAATGTGALLLATIDVTAAGALVQVWMVTAVWISIRTLLGMARVWPGIGNAPLRG